MNGFQAFLKFTAQIAFAPIALWEYTSGTGFGPGAAALGILVGVLAWVVVITLCVVTGHPLITLGVYLGLCAALSGALMFADGAPGGPR